MPLIAALGSLLAPLLGGIAKTISIETVKWLAYRAFTLFIVFVAIPIVLYNVLTGMLFDFMDYAMTYVSGSGVSAFTLQLTGMGAYIASKIQLVQAFSTYMSFVAIRFIMRFIPFLR